MTVHNGNKTETIGHGHEKVHIKGGAANRTRRPQAVGHDFGSLQEDNRIKNSVKAEELSSTKHPSKTLGQLMSHQSEQQKIITVKSHINLL